MSKHSPTSPIVAQRRKGRRYSPGLSALLDRATVEIENTTDPGVLDAYRRLVAELERIAMPKAVGH